MQGCGDDWEDIIPCEFDADCDEPTPSPSPDPDPVEPTPSPSPANPDCPAVTMFGQDGSLWKPRSDEGKLVVLLPSRYRGEFRCTATRKDGEVEVLRYTGFANDDRQHHRGELAGGKYENNGTVSCEDSRQVCLFRFQGKARNRHG